jgi:hypothetical protein
MAPLSGVHHHTQVLTKIVAGARIAVSEDESRAVEREDDYWNGFIDDFLGIYNELAA